MTDITPIIEAIISLLVVIITVVLIPWIAKKYGNTKVEQISYWVGVAVKAAEQIYKGFEKSGIQKKNYVLEFLNKSGITYNPDKINALIEAEVLKLSKGDEE